MGVAVAVDVALGRFDRAVPGEHLNIVLTRQGNPISVAARRAANDGFRCSLTCGAVLVSAGVVTLGSEAHARIIAAVQAFDDFDTDDPWDVHDIGDLEVATGDPATDRDSELVFFRIARPPAAEPTLTILLAREWASAIKTIHRPNSIKEHRMNDVTKGAASDQDDTARSAKIAELNDAFRRTLRGGTLLMTAGIMALGQEAQDRILIAVRAFDDFSDDNDPWCEHDFGSIEIDVGMPSERERIFFKIDYYDKTKAMGSEDPADPAITERVMTIMLASEY